jgi:hypothetical protein
VWENGKLVAVGLSYLGVLSAVMLHQCTTYGSRLRLHERNRVFLDKVYLISVNRTTKERVAVLQVSKLV